MVEHPLNGRDANAEMGDQVVEMMLGDQVVELQLLNKEMHMLKLVTK